MTIKKRLARSNIAMLVIPLLVAAALLLLGVGAVLLLLRENMTTLHDAMEQMERVLHGFKLTLSIYAAAAVAVLLAAAALTDLYLTRSLFRHISRPLDTLTAGMARIRDGDLDAPIAYDTPDEFKAACDAVDEMAARLFAFARMDVSQYPVHPEPLALRPALEAVAGEQEGAAVTVDVPDMTVRADRELLRRIAVNLLDNSRKYGGRADVHVRITTEADGETAAISFTDDGAGVPPEQLPRLFDAFYRGDAARTAPGSGSGLGLAVVKKSAEEMGGAVRAENAENGGLRVIVTLPLAQEGGNG